MATEQDWSAYADQAFLANNDTLLARTAVGAGAEVLATHLIARRSAGGPFTAAGSGDVLALYSSSPTCDLLLANSSGEVRYGSSSGAAVIQTGGQVRCRITPAGNLLLGTNALAAGNWSHEIKITQPGAWPLALNAVDRGMVIRNSSATSGFYFYFEYNGGTNNGSITWSGATTYYNTTSDARLKENIAPADDAGAIIDSMRVRQFDWIVDGYHQRFGFVAQELIEVAPEAVHAPADDEMMMAVDYSKLVPMLVKEVQALRLRLDAVESAV